MIPRTLSASSLQVAELCMDRWVEEYINRAPSFNNNAAMIGTAFHGGAEMFVKAVFIDKTHAHLDRKKQLELLITFYTNSYVETFQSGDITTPEYEDGLELTKRWFKRTDLGTKPMLYVESAEVKETIKVPYNHPDGSVQELNFNYIIDRVDRIGETEYEVVDYKTIRVPLQPEDLESKIQARAYALAIQIKHPDATKITVTFDQIRHDTISMTFGRDDNIAFWRFLTASAQRIVDMKPEDVRPTLNPECGYCVKKYTCPLMQKNIAAGGIHSLSVTEAVVTIEQLTNQMKANKRIVEDLTDKVMLHAAQTDQLEWADANGTIDVAVTARGVRKFPADRAAEIMGPELFAQMGNMTITNLEKVIKDESLDPEMRAQLQGLIYKETGNLSLKIKPRKTLGV